MTVLEFYNPLTCNNVKARDPVGSKNWKYMIPWTLTFLHYFSKGSENYSLSRKKDMKNVRRFFILLTFDIIWSIFDEPEPEPERSIAQHAWSNLPTPEFIEYIRSLPEEPHLVWVGATFSDFRHLSWAYFLCKWAKILICWRLTLLQ